MRKKIAVFLSMLCLVLAGLGCFAVSATDDDIAVVNSGYNNSAETDNTYVMSHSHYASIISKNSAHNNRYKDITAQVYYVNNSTEICLDEDYSSGNSYHYDAVIDPTGTNNFLAVGAMGNTMSEQAGYEEWVVILTKKYNTSKSLPRDYYEDYL